MTETPICTSVEQDLGLSFDEITGPRPEYTVDVPAPAGPAEAEK